MPKRKPRKKPNKEVMDEIFEINFSDMVRTEISMCW